MEQNKDNDVSSYMENPANISVQGNMSMAGAKNTPIRPLTAAYRSAKSENEVVRNNQAPQKTNTFVGKAMEYMFGW
ncbi:hypothetical protein FSP39_020618 [Pinctada imbricata]|uniref:Uncharacterized protein n=1 Tax=Pinctada imbricata TaxID=66713 RepID=A0AA88YP67_PINIB|nr:hypothetical protein FSP39_020618 [Pinctada imbricata]